MASAEIGASALLDKATLKDRFKVMVHPTCGEAIVVRNIDFSKSLGDLDAARIAEKNAVRFATKEQRSLESSRARTRGKVRRWCVHNQASRKATLTFRDDDLPDDIDEMWQRVKFFRRRLDRAGIPQPLLVPEAGSKTGRLHLHGAMRTYVKQSDLADLWGHGFVSLDRRQAGGDSGDREIMRRQASYLAGYVSKIGKGSAFDLVGKGRRRYSIPTKSSPPPPERLSGDSLYELIVEAQRLCGHDLEQRWSSDALETWEGPPTAVLMG